MKMYEITFRVPKQKSMSTDQITTRKMKAKNFSESSAVAYAWFVWEKGYQGSPEIDWIN